MAKKHVPVKMEQWPLMVYVCVVQQPHGHGDRRARLIFRRPISQTQDQNAASARLASKYSAMVAMVWQKGARHPRTAMLLVWSCATAMEALLSMTSKLIVKMMATTRTALVGGQRHTGVLHSVILCALKHLEYFTTPTKSTGHPIASTSKQSRHSAAASKQRPTTLFHHATRWTVMSRTESAGAKTAPLENIGKGTSAST